MFRTNTLRKPPLRAQYAIDRMSGLQIKIPYDQQILSSLVHAMLYMFHPSACLPFPLPNYLRGIHLHLSATETVRP